MSILRSVSEAINTTLSKITRFVEVHVLDRLVAREISDKRKLEELCCIILDRIGPVHSFDLAHFCFIIDFYSSLNRGKPISNSDWGYTDFNLESSVPEVTVYSMYMDVEIDGEDKHLVKRNDLSYSIDYLSEDDIEYIDECIDNFKEYFFEGDKIDRKGLFLYAERTARLSLSSGRIC